MVAGPGQAGVARRSCHHARMHKEDDILYYWPGSASFVVHWLLIELGRPHRLVPVDLQGGAQKSAEYLALNPAGVVPTLVVDGVARTEAGALLLMLADADPQARFAPRHDDPRRADCLQWMFHLANVVQPLLRNWWYPHEPAGQAHRDAVFAQTAQRMEAAWQRIDDHLAAHGPYMLGDAASIVDFHLTMLLRWSREMPRPGDDWPHLAALARRMKARPSFTELYAREGLDAWR